MLEKKQLLAVNLVANGDFESSVEVAGLQLDSQVAGWNAFGEQAADRKLDIIETNFENGNVLKLDYATGSTGRVYQDVPTEAGQTYLLTFDMYGPGNGEDFSDEVRVLWGNTQSGTFRGAGIWQTVAAELTGTGDIMRLELREIFSSSGSDGQGPYIDNVSLTAVTKQDLANSGFEDGTFDPLDSRTAISDLPNWFTDGPVEDRLVSIRRYGDFAPETNGDYYWNLDTSSRYDRLFHPVETEANKSYVVTFDVRSPLPTTEETNQLRVRWNGKWVATHVPAQVWQSFAVEVSGENDGTSWLDLREAFLSPDRFGDGAGPWIDNVRVYEIDQVFSDISLDLNGGEAGEAFSAVFNGETPDVNVVAESATLTAPEGTLLNAVNVQISNVYDEFDEVLSASTAGSDIAASYDDELGILALTGLGSVESYENVLRTVRYSNLSLSPTEREREIVFEFENNAGETTSDLSPLSTSTPSATTTVSVFISEDTDGDGITNRAELDFYGTDPNEFDTDGDLLPDGIEIRSPGLSPTIVDDNQADLDGDSLNNLDEVIFRTRLHRSDSDRDGVSDGDEVSQGSDPNDRSDQGMPPSESELVELTLVVGDHSGSHSERYNLHVGTVVHQAMEFGVVSARPYTFRRGSSYPITIVHRDSNLEEADFDYTANILSNDGTPIFIEDEFGILGRHDESSPFFASGKEAILHIPKVEIEELSFTNTNGNVIRDDSLEVFTAPHWSSSSEQGEPVSYTAGSEFAVEAKLKITPADIFTSANVEVSSQNDFEIIASDSSIAGDTVSFSGTASRGFESSVGLETLGFDWSIELGLQDSEIKSVPAGSTENLAYVTLSDPITPNLYESVLDIGSRNAEGLSNQSEVVDAIWGDFSDRSVSRVDGTVLTYYRGSFQQCPFGGSRELLVSGDGQCSTWAALLTDSLHAQGIQSASIIRVAPATPSNGFLVSNWGFPGGLGSSPSTAPYSFIHNIDTFDQRNVLGQGRIAPTESEFGLHFIVKVDNRYYDPSYGGASYASQNDWENSSLSGFFLQSGPNFLVKKNDPNTLETTFTPVQT